MQLNVSLYRQYHHMESSHTKLQKMPLSIKPMIYVMMTEVSKIFEVFVLARCSIAEVQELFQEWKFNSDVMGDPPLMDSSPDVLDNNTMTTLPRLRQAMEEV